MKITLDGKPAIVAEKSDGFWIVKTLDGRGGDVEFSRHSVDRILAKDGKFES